MKYRNGSFGVNSMTGVSPISESLHHISSINTVSCRRHRVADSISILFRGHVVSE